MDFRNHLLSHWHCAMIRRRVEAVERPSKAGPHPARACREEGPNLRSAFAYELEVPLVQSVWHLGRVHQSGGSRTWDRY